MPPFLTALSNTSVIFWKDEEPLTWSQSLVLLAGLSGFWELAQFGYAGGAPRLPFYGVVIAVQCLIALIQVVVGERLGPLSHFGPPLVRMLSVALVFGSGAIALNAEVRWAEGVPPLPPTLGGHRGSVCLLSALLVGILLAVRTVRGAKTGGPIPWRHVALGALFVTSSTATLLYYGVIPQSTTK